VYYLKKALLFVFLQGPIRVCLPALATQLKRQQGLQQATGSRESSSTPNTFPSGPFQDDLAQPFLAHTKDAVRGLTDCLLSIICSAAANSLDFSGSASLSSSSSSAAAAAGGATRSQTEIGEYEGDVVGGQGGGGGVGGGGGERGEEGSGSRGGGVWGMTLAVRLGTDVLAQEHSVLLVLAASKQEIGEAAVQLCAAEMGPLFC